MKALNQAVCFGAVLTAIAQATCFAQEFGSAEHLRSLATQQREQAIAKQEHDKKLEAGAALFGSDPRWIEFDNSGRHIGVHEVTAEQRKNPVCGSIAGKPFSDFRIGDWGCSAATPRRPLAMVSNMAGRLASSADRRTAGDNDARPFSYSPDERGPSAFH